MKKIIVLIGSQKLLDVLVTNLLIQTCSRFAATLIGYKFTNGLTFSGNYTQGLNSIYKGKANLNTGYKIRSRYFNFSDGYMLQGSKIIHTTNW